MKPLFQEASEAESLYRQILDNALDAFIAIDPDSNIIDWSRQAESTFGWSREEVLGRPLTDTVVPPRFRAAHREGMKRYLRTGEGAIVNNRIEIVARRKDGSEIPVELAVTSIPDAGRTVFFAALRDISQRRALEEELQRQASITHSILQSMAGALVVADLSERLVMVNPAGQHLLNVKPVEQDANQSIHSYTLLRPDGKTAYRDAERPMARALTGEHVDGVVAMVRHAGLEEDVWVSINARPLLDSRGVLIGSVGVFQDITELRRRQQELADQSRRLQKLASLLDLSHDAILTRTLDDVITYWNRSAERVYGFSREEAIGQVSHTLLKTRFPVPLEQVRATLDERRYWEGELVHVAKDGRELHVHSQWSLDIRDGQAYRYLEINADITERLQAEQALKQSQEDLRLLIDATTDYAIMMMDADGTVLTWNAGAERILGLSASEAIGQPIARIFTTEDQQTGEPLRELEEARMSGRSEDDRWHMRRDGSRFWATGVVTPLHHEDGSLRGFVKIMRDQTEHRLAEEQTQFLANHDVLTGLPNRVHLSNKLHQSIALSQRSQVPMAVLLLDLDRFKQVNDTYGHHAGDLLLKEVATRILSSIRETDFVARLGGDEFVIIQADVSQPDAAETLARKLVLELGRPYRLDTDEISSGTSIGLCLYPRDGKNPVELLKRADLALYRAKHAGRHTYQFYSSELVSEQAWKKDREAALRAALDKHQFELYYQPLIDLGNWKISSVEALLRWNASELETVLPGEFIDIVEQSGMIVAIGEWALREACHQVRRWQEQGMSELRLAVNCSLRQFSDPQFVAGIPSILEGAGLSPESLELEVPEAMLAQHPEIKEQLNALRALGIRLAIDNFGTGATALIDFKDFEIDALKIDKSFVQHLPHRREDSAITSTIISLAHNLGIRVIAGGVETAEQLAYLRARDCTAAQGFIFSPPVPAQQFEELLLDGNWSRINRNPLMTDIGAGIDHLN